MESKEEMPSGDFSCFLQSKARKCNCTFIQKTTGDGCDTCNPALALSFCKEQNATLIEKNEKLRNELQGLIRVINQPSLRPSNEGEWMNLRGAIFQTLKDTENGK